MRAYFLIAIGSGLGGMARHWLSTVIAARITSVFPWGTFAVNAAGSVLIGLALALPALSISSDTRQFVTAGILGGFTTFSAFSAQTVQLMQSGKILLAMAYVVASVLVCVAGCWLGSVLVNK